MTYVVAILFLVLAVSSSVLLFGFANTRRASHRAKAVATATSAPTLPAPARRTQSRSLPKPPPLSEDVLSLREIDRTFSAPQRFRFESRLGAQGRG